MAAHPTLPVIVLALYSEVAPETLNPGYLWKTDWTVAVDKSTQCEEYTLISSATLMVTKVYSSITCLQLVAAGQSLGSCYVQDHSVLSAV